MVDPEINRKGRRKKNKRLYFKILVAHFKIEPQSETACNLRSSMDQWFLLREDDSLAKVRDGESLTEYYGRLASSAVELQEWAIFCLRILRIIPTIVILIGLVYILAEDHLVQREVRKLYSKYS